MTTSKFRENSYPQLSHLVSGRRQVTSQCAFGQLSVVHSQACGDRTQDLWTVSLPIALSWAAVCHLQPYIYMYCQVKLQRDLTHIKIICTGTQISHCRFKPMDLSKLLAGGQQIDVAFKKIKNIFKEMKTVPNEFILLNVKTS